MEGARGAAAAPPDADAPCKVQVFGYPNYTQPQDLTRAFVQFGNVRVDKINQKFATLAFSNMLEAKAALKASNKVSIYGSLLTVRPHTAAPAPAAADKQKNSPKRAFKKTKQKSIIINPGQIDLSGDFHQQLDAILATVRLTQEEVTDISTLYSDLENVLQAQWPGCAAIPFGSIPTGLGIKTSDADCFIRIPPHFRHPNANFVNKTRRILLQYPHIFAEILAIPRANTPIVKFFHIPTETNCDVSFKTELGTRNSQLIAFLLHADPRLLPMAVVIKYWAKVHEFSGTGKLTNYALIMLIIFYLQQPPVSILPSVQWLQKDPSDELIVDYWNTGFMSQKRFLPKTSNRSTISELIGGFFEYYSMFNFEEMIVCPYLGYPIKKDAFKDIGSLPEGFERYRDNVVNQVAMSLRFTASVCVQDPFEQCHNLASAISSKLADEIKAYFKFAANAYEKEKLNNCEKFLETILLHKPKITRTRGNPEFRSNLFPNMISNIISPDWKSVVRNVVFVIFEDMLKIKLGKVEEKVNPDSRKEKEKYMGTLTKAIWKRKQFTKLYSVMKMEIKQKQARITEEIMSTDKEQINVQFQTTLTFCHEPKSAVVSIKMASGDVAAFKEFGKFFVSVLQSWFLQLLKPYSRNPEIDTAAKIAETIKYLDNNLNSTVDSDDSVLSENAQSASGSHAGDPVSGACTGDPAKGACTGNPAKGTCDGNPTAAAPRV